MCAVWGKVGKVWVYVLFVWFLMWLLVPESDFSLSGIFLFAELALIEDDLYYQTTRLDGGFRNRGGRRTVGRALDSGAEPPRPEGGRELALVAVWEQVYSNLVVCMDGWFTFFYSTSFHTPPAKQVALSCQQPTGPGLPAQGLQAAAPLFRQTVPPHWAAGPTFSTLYKFNLGTDFLGPCPRALAHLC